MKELTVFEMQEVSAGAEVDFGSRIAGAAIGSITAAVWGTLIGGTQSGANGGLLGFGLIGNAVGAIWGFIAGGIAGAAGGFAVGFDVAIDVVEKSFRNVIDGKFVPWAQ